MKTSKYFYTYDRYLSNEYLKSLDKIWVKLYIKKSHGPFSTTVMNGNQNVGFFHVLFVTHMPTSILLRKGCLIIALSS